MTELPNIILPSDLVSVDQSGPHSAPPSMSMTSDSNPSHISTREIKHTSLDSTVHFSYSNSIDRHNHNESPYLVPRSATSVFDQQNGRDFSDDVSTPLSNLLNSPRSSDRSIYGYYSSTVLSSPMQDPGALTAGHSSRASFGLFDSLAGHELSPNMTPRRNPPLHPVPSIEDFHHHNHHHFLHHPSYPSNPSNPSTQYPPHTIADPQGLEATEAELKTLQRRLRGLEIELERTKSQRLLGIPPPDLQERTRFREQKFCTLNRAGNALCAWHDSRRERRLYPPRMAPYRTLNCGCTYSEALFEESLSRNGVGSFWPGEHVRMDPSLRNCLLKLLQRVYGYDDGDFERNTDSTWKGGQDAAAWEERARRPVRRERF